MQDRLAELRDLVLQSNVGLAEKMLPGPSVVMADPGRTKRGNFDVEAQMGILRDEGKAKDEKGFMGDFFTKADDVQKGIASITGSLDVIRQLRQQTAQTTTPEKEKEISDRLGTELDATNGTVLKIKKELEQKKKKKKKKKSTLR
eukprot:Trichotokara_eunicae@DN1877_c0_g1_i1.p1